MPGTNLDILSERTQCTLILLQAFYEHYVSGKDVRKSYITDFTNIPRQKVNESLCICYRAGLLSTDSKGRLIPGENFSISTVYQLIEECDGWLHIGNAAHNSLRYGSNPYSAHLDLIENNISNKLYSCLSSVKIIDMLSRGNSRTPYRAVYQTTS